MSLAVEKRTPSMNRSSPFCHNRCKATNNVPKAASHIIWMIGRPTHVCKRCAEEWAAIWDRQLADIDARRADETEAAA